MAETLIPGGTLPFEGGHRGFVGSSNEPNPPLTNYLAIINNNNNSNNNLNIKNNTSINKTFSESVRKGFLGGQNKFRK